MRPQSQLEEFVGAVPDFSGRYVLLWRAVVPTRCGQCGRTVRRDETFVEWHQAHYCRGCHPVLCGGADGAGSGGQGDD